MTCFLTKLPEFGCVQTGILWIDLHVTDSNSSENPLKDLFCEGILCMHFIFFGLVVHISWCSVFSRLICFPYIFLHYLGLPEFCSMSFLFLYLPTATIQVTNALTEKDMANCLWDEATSRPSKASRKINGWQGSIELLHPFDAAYAISYANMMPSKSYLILSDSIWWHLILQCLDATCG